MRQPVRRDRDPVFRGHSCFDHIELQAADDTHNRIACPGCRHEHLQQPLFSKLPDRFIKSLVPHVGGPQDRELLGWKLGDLRKLHAPARIERVADGHSTRVDDADDVAWERFRNGFAIAAEEAIDPRQPQLSVEPGVHDEHVLREASRADAHECNAVAMTGVHVRLDLEDEA